MVRGPGRRPEAARARCSLWLENPPLSAYNQPSTRLRATQPYAKGAATMTTLGTLNAPGATRVLLLGSGELGKEVSIELMRLGCEVIAVDRYANAPAMQVAHRSQCHRHASTVPPIRGVVEQERPHFIVPEIEAIATDELLKLEQEGITVVPTARAASLTMNREGIRRLAAEELGLNTSPYRFAGTREEYLAAVRYIGLPCVVKPVMSSSGKGQSLVKQDQDVDAAWDYAQSGGRAGQGRVIVEGFVDFEYEDHPADRAPPGRHRVLRAHRPPPGGRRLPRVLAAAADERRRPGGGGTAGQSGHRCPGRARPVRRGVLRQRRPGVVQ